jgi:sugar lactone lactonase YvrE
MRRVGAGRGPNGTLANQTDRVFADLTGSEPGGPDGMKVDAAGNVYCGGVLRPGVSVRQPGCRPVPGPAGRNT